MAIRMHTAERRRQIVHYRRERCIESGKAPDHHIIMAIARVKRADQSHRFAQTPPDAVALDGTSGLLRDRKPGSRTTFPAFPAVAGLQGQCRGVGLAAVAYKEKILALQ